MTEAEFLERWSKERPMYEAWGHIVVERIMDAVEQQVTPLSADIFVRIPPKPRLKANSSILEKAFYRNKNYQDPYDDITDKVGVRFVVLITRQIEIVEKAILDCPDWEASKDRDYEQEQAENPIQFDYAAVHYVVRSRLDNIYGGIKVLAGTACEVQVKTILQHAYGELTHDTIYKPTVNATHQMRRAAAKSMALIEATNDYFSQVVSEVESVVSPNKSVTDQLSLIYIDKIQIVPEPTKAEGLILEAYQDQISVDCFPAIKKLFEDKPFLVDRVKEQSIAKLLFRQPVILLVYYFVDVTPHKMKLNWPLTPEELRPIFVDLGKAFDSF